MLKYDQCNCRPCGLTECCHSIIEVLDDLTNYTFRVASANRVGRQFSNPVTAIVPSPHPPPISYQPLNLSVQDAGPFIFILWSAVEEAAGYRVSVTEQGEERRRHTLLERNPTHNFTILPGM